MYERQLLPPAHLLRERVKALYRRGNQPGASNEALAQAFDELELALEALQAAEERLQARDEDLLNERTAFAIEAQRYQDLFVEAPAGYLVTSLDGTIRQANRAAAALLQSDEKQLVGRSLSLFVPEGQRRAVRAQIAGLSELDQVYEWEMRLQPWHGGPFDAELIVGVVRGRNGRPSALRWLIHDISERKQAEEQLRARIAELEQQVSSLEAQRAAQPQSAGIPDSVENKARLRRLCAFFAEASMLLAATYDIESTLTHVARLAVPAVADGCILDILETADGRRQLVVADSVRGGQQRPQAHWHRYSPAGDKLQAHLQASLVIHADDQAKRIDTTLVDVAPSSALRAVLSKLAPTSAVVAPLLLGSRTLGSFTLLSVAAENSYGQMEAVLIEELARRIAIAVDRLRDDVAVQSYSD